MPPGDRASWSPIRIATWAIAACASLYFFGPVFLHELKPRDRQFLDFSQEWLSAKNYWAGLPVYSDQTEAVLRHTGTTAEHPEELLLWNAHPPVAVLLTLPFAKLDYRTAHLLWNLLTLPLLVASLWLIVRELRVPFQIWSLFPAIVLILLCGPLHFQVLLGQFNLPLLFLLTLAWVLDRRDYVRCAGVALGFAAALKLFPLFAFAYFLFARRWQALLTGGLTFLIANGLTILILGVREFETYARVVVPSLNHYQSSWRNTSLSGFWLRLFNPHAEEQVVPLVENPALAQVLIAISRLAIVAILARLTWFARTAGEKDQVYAATLVGMILAAPFAWTHYFCLLAMPLAFVWMRGTHFWQRILFWLVLVVMWAPENAFVALADPSLAATLNGGDHRPIMPLLSLTACSVFTYALVILFILVVGMPVRQLESFAPTQASN